MCTVKTTGEGDILDAGKSAPRFEPRSHWSTLPVQPPAGSWQLRSARVFPALVLNLVLFFAWAFIAHRNSATWVLFSILLAGIVLQGVFFFVVGIRGAQLERRERELGYTTWARKR
jgi:hypothetical protein